GEIGAASLVKPRAVGRKYPVNANFEPGRKQDGPMQGVFQFAHVARPAARIKRASGLDRERTQRKVVGLWIFLEEPLRQRAGIRRTLASGGIFRFTTFRRNNRSSRNLPSQTASVRLRFDVAMIRISTGTRRLPL